jgi:hypothetical protein
MIIKIRENAKQNNPNRTVQEWPYMTNTYAVLFRN